MCPPLRNHAISQDDDLIGVDDRTESICPFGAKAMVADTKENRKCRCSRGVLSGWLLMYRFSTQYGGESGYLRAMTSVVLPFDTLLRAL